MQNRNFGIEFFCQEDVANYTGNAANTRYRALVTVISKNFQLFKVTRLQRIDDDSITDLSENYVLTSYPYDKNIDPKWKDAATFTSNSFFETLGAAIDSRLYNAFLN